MIYKLNLNDSPAIILDTVRQFLLDAMDLVEQRDEEGPIITAYEAFDKGTRMKAQE
jgi:hypothetical protein